MTTAISSPRIAVCRVAALLLSLLLGGMLAHAQTNQGEIAGNVQDSSGAVVVGAIITAKSESTGTVYKATSTSAGSYRFPSIQLGRYDIATKAKGFKSAVSTGVEVRVGSISALNITLSAGGASETITVQANAPTIQTQSSDVGGTVTSQQILNLPLALGGVGAMRSPEAFVFLIPGNTGPGSANNQDNGVFLSKLGGGQNFGAEVLLDGASIIRSENGSSFDEAAPSVEAISEFKVTNSTPAAEYGRTTGGIESFTTKSGTNQYHGSAFDLFRNDALDANSWFNNGFKAYYQSIGDPTEANYNRPSDKKNDYGGSLGGPVTIPHLYNGKDKTFFFFAWEQYRQTLGGTTISNVPTPAERTGNFQDRLINGTNGQINPCDGKPIFNGEIFDPATTRTVNTSTGPVTCRLPFGTAPGTANSPFPADFNVIPQNRFSPVGKAIANLYPAPTNPSLLNGNYSLSSSSPVVNTTYTIRIDEAINEKNKIYGSYSSRDNTRNNPTNRAFPGAIDNATQVQDFITHYGRGGWDYVISPSVLNHLNIGYNRTNSINRSFYVADKTNFPAQLGISNLPSQLLPEFTVNGEANLGRNQNGDNIDNGIRINDSVNWQKGRNSFKFGVDYRYQQYSVIVSDFLNGTFSFQGSQTKATQTGPYQDGTGYGYASLLLGQGDYTSVTVAYHQPRWISDYEAVFAQDDFKVSNNLTLNLGIRYSIDRPRKEAGNNTSNFSPTAIDPRSGIPGAFIFATNCTSCNKRWADTWFKDIAPRIGFAYTLPNSEGKTVLRGGFATMYAPLQYSDSGGATTQGYSANPAFPSNGFDPAFDIGNGFPAYQTGINLDPGQLDNGNANAPRNFNNYIKPSYGRPAQINQWNLQVQHQISTDLIATLGYIGSASSHLKSQLENVNNMPRSNFSRGDALSQYNLGANGVATPYTGFNGQLQQSLRPFPQYAYITTDCCLQNVGHSSYNALIASLERRFRQGLTLQASYTWSKTLTNADSIINTTNGVAQEQDPFDSKSQKALSYQDIPHTFVLSYLYELPFGKNKTFLNSGGRLVNSLVGGWQVGAVQRYQSGEPFTFQGVSGIPGWDNLIEATRIPGSSISSNARKSGKIDPFRQLKAQNKLTAPDPNVDSIFNGLLIPLGPNGQPDNPNYAALQTSPAFIDQNTPDYRRLRAKQVGNCSTCDNGGFLFGDVPRVVGEVRNFEYFSEDFSVVKLVPITEAVNFSFKIEALNAFNRHIFSTPDTSYGDAGFGVPTATQNAPRGLQLTGRIQF